MTDVIILGPAPTYAAEQALRAMHDDKVPVMLSHPEPSNVYVLTAHDALDPFFIPNPNRQQRRAQGHTAHARKKTL